MRKRGRDRCFAKKTDAQLSVWTAQKARLQASMTLGRSYGTVDREPWSVDGGGLESGLARLFSGGLSCDRPEGDY